MNTRDQFGNYLLLKKLAEDPLGETFRAGKVGRQTLERVMLLRVLNGSGFDPERIARALQARSALAQALKSPTIGQAADVGQVRGVPYIAYDYASGRSLAQLLEQAGRRNSPLPLDHAMLVAERVALALAVAHETRYGDERVQHGFLTPHLIHVTNEGELKVLGFEASTGLRESVSHPIVKQAVGRYLAPEALAGQPAARSDDVYSLGAMLFEMLTGQAWSGQAAAIDSAVVAADGTPLPAEIAAVLRRSLAPREQRVPEIVTWHKTVAKLMADNGWAATTFNLAFFLHNLYRDEIDRESRELESEKNQAASLVAAVAVRTAEPAPATAAPSAVRTSGPVREDTSVLRDEYGLPAKRRGPNMAVLGGAAAAVVLAVVGYLMFGRGGAAPAPQAEAPPQAAAPAAPPAPTGMTPEQIQALLDQALAKQKQEIEAGLKATSSQQAEEIRALQQQLDDSRRRATAPPPTVQVAAQPPAPAATTPAAASAPPAVETPSAPAQPAPTTASQPTPTPAPTTQSATPATTPAAAAPRPAAPAPVQPAPAARSAPAVKEGDLVSMEAGVSPPRVTRQPPLTYPQVARRLGKEASITVRVLVDERGRVVDIQQGGSKVGFGLDEAAVAHARMCQWEPARKEGVKVKMWTDLRVVFKL